MAEKFRNSESFDYQAQAQKMIDSYLDEINSKGKGLYNVPEDEYARVAEDLKQNNGLLFEPIHIKKADK